MSVNKYDATHDLLLQIAGSGSEGSFHRTSPVQALAGATSVTISDSKIYATSLVTPFADNGTNEPIAWATMTLSEGSCVITFDALEADTDFELVVLADSLSEDAYITDLKDVNISSVSNGQVLAYNGTTQKWVNIDYSGGGLKPHLIINTDTNLTVTVTKGTKVITATETSTGIYECDVDEYGTYTMSNGTESASVDIKACAEYELDFRPDGSTVIPTNDIQTWLACAGIKDKTSYTTISDVLGDNTSLLALMSTNNAVDYMERSTSWASDVCAVSTAMSYIGVNDYCANKLLNNGAWSTAILASSYFDSVLNVKVPTMTSDTTPMGECFAGNEKSTAKAYLAFDGSNTTHADIGNTSTSGTIGYKFSNPVSVRKAYYYITSPTSYSRTYKYQYSDDGTTWTDATSAMTKAMPINAYTDISNYGAHLYWRLNITSSTNNWDYYAHTLQFFGR